MTDTLVKVIRDTVVVKPDAMEIMEKTKAYYDDAWGKMLLYSGIVSVVITIIAGLIAFAVPYWLKKQQEAQHALNETKLKEEFRDELAKLKSQITKETQSAAKKIAEDSAKAIDKNIREDMFQLTSFIDGKISFNEADRYISEGDLETGFEQLLFSFESFTKSANFDAIVFNISLILEKFLTANNGESLKSNVEKLTAEGHNPREIISAFKERFGSDPRINVGCLKLLALLN